MDKHEGVARYSLILETDDNKKYYFDTNLGNFVKLDEGKKPARSTLQALDFLTSNFPNRHALKDSYGIDGELSKIYITYQFKGEKRLACVFNNSTWQHIALTYNGKEIDYRDKINLDAFNEVYSEISNIPSYFADELVKNKTKLINLSPNTINTILGLRAHKCATMAKERYGFSMNFETYDAVSRVYSEDAYGFYQDLKKQLSRYREFRTVYMNYCKYINKKDEKTIAKDDLPKKKVIIPPKQLSMFDKED